MSEPTAERPDPADRPDPAALAWTQRYAAALGLEAPDEAAFLDLLALAAHAAHASHRQAAPVACWLAARAGQDPAGALELARTLPSP
jgi:hypothetical protein